MPRACVIVLDAVGAGALPDAAEFGDEGSDTLGNVARAVGGLDLPNLEALGLGNVEPLEGCPPMPGAPAVAGRLVERSKGKDTTLGHWELMGIVTPQPLPTYPHGFPFEVIDPFMHRTGRGVLGNRPASGTEIIQELGEEHQETGKWIVYTSADSVFQIAAHEDTIPLDELYDACRIAREILVGKHAVGRVIARPFVGEPGNYERTPNRHDFSLEPRRPNYLTLVREAGQQVHGVGKIPDIFAHLDIDGEHPTKSNVEGITQTEKLLRELDSGLIFTNLVETDMLWGHRNDPSTSTAACRTSTVACPTYSTPCGPGPADHHLRPWVRPDDAVDGPFARACPAARLRPGQERRGTYPRGRVRRRRRDRQRLARRQGAAEAAPGPADRRAVTGPGIRGLNDPVHVRRQYEDEDNLRARKAVYDAVDGPDPRGIAVAAVSEVRHDRVLEVGCGEGELSERLAIELGAEVVALDQSPRMVELASARGIDASIGDVQRLPFADGSFDVAVAAWMLYHVPDLDRALGELARVLVRGGRLVAVTNRATHLQEMFRLVGVDRWELPFGAENGEEFLARHFARVELRDGPGRSRSRTPGRSARISARPSGCWRTSLPCPSSTSRWSCIVARSSSWPTGRCERTRGADPAQA